MELLLSISITLLLLFATYELACGVFWGRTAGVKIVVCAFDPECDVETSIELAARIARRYAEGNEIMVLVNQEKDSAST